MSSRHDLKLDWCSYEAAKYACEKWHYSGSIPHSKLAKIGVWEDGIFIGAVIYGVGATSTLVQRYGLRPEQGAELVRVALRKHRSEVSRILAISVKMIKKSFPGLQLIVSFADPEQDHIGVIYKACGWVYTGKSQPSPEYVYLGKRWQGRSFRHKYKGMEHHPDVVIVDGSAKHRYLYPLTDAMRATIALLSRPYPQRATSIVVDAPGDQPGEGGAEPTVALQINQEVS